VSLPWKGKALPLSYRRACEAAPTGSSPTVTVCTNHLALVDLPQDGLPFVRSQAGRDVEGLVSQVIELQNDGIGLPAVDAGPLAEELDEELHPFGHERFFPPIRRCDVSLPVGEVVLAFVRGATRATVGVSLSAVTPVPRELRGGPDLPASRAAKAAACMKFRRHEHMFASRSDDELGRWP
jgi:hypothetical protein